MPRVPSLLIAVVAALTLTACDAAAERIAEEAAEQAIGGDAEIDVDDEGAGISVETDDGSVEFNAGDGTELPDGLPAAIPLPSDFAVISSSSFTNEDGESLLVMLEVENLDPAAFIEDEVVPSLESAGYEIVAQSTTSGTDATVSSVQAENDTETLTVNAQNGADGGAIVNISVFPPS